ncbi:hypothetical protein DEJ21_14105 [Curtobacterium sp. MCSS17_006]|uniref:hypothetical protein n=1 Tax=Curtobacterium sp. MCSS17_006 TaxID=2175642 RepID=UPI000DA70421|nr:hypothetical protein [Curtobacterium sp. MCSS17_006]PZE33978.1 hypothetical protein DEJ21_14105 [Curtobacterium sp. MCSS17_006]
MSEMSDEEYEMLMLRADDAMLYAREVIAKGFAQAAASLNGLTAAIERFKAAEDTEFEAIAMYYDDGWDILRDSAEEF